MFRSVLPLVEMRGNTMEILNALLFVGAVIGAFKLIDRIVPFLRVF